MIQQIIDKDNEGYFGWLAECDTDAAHGIIGEEHITRRYPKKHTAVGRMRELSHLLDWPADFDRMEDRCL